MPKAPAGPPCTDCDGQGAVLDMTAPAFCDLTPCDTCDGRGHIPPAAG